MVKQRKVLVLDPDLDTLSKVYLSLVHRNFKAEASDNPLELEGRLKRFKPALLIISREALEVAQPRPSMPMIVIESAAAKTPANIDGDVLFIQKPITSDKLMQLVDQLLF